MRDYDPTTGRYIQADPLGLVDGASVYGYVGQNPFSFYDFDGQQKTKYYVRNSDGSWRCVPKDTAERYRALGKDVRIGGPVSAGKSRKMARKSIGKKRVQHGPHGRGQFSHWQHRNGGRGHIFYGPRGGTNALGILGGMLLFRDFYNQMNPDWEKMCAMDPNCV